jgi:protein TonB
VIEEPEIFTIVEDMPVFPGCEGESSKQARDACTQQEIYKYIQGNAKYPPMAKDAGISGTVFIKFVIDENGKVSSTEILRGVAGGKSLDDAAVTAVKSLPKFKPGKQRGKPVRVQYTVPVKFNLR